MNLKAMDLGVCGVEQLLQAGTIRFDTKKMPNKGIELMGTARKSHYHESCGSC